MVRLLGFSYDPVAANSLSTHKRAEKYCQFDFGEENLNKTVKR